MTKKAPRPGQKAKADAARGHRRYRVGRSKIHGRGVFATERIRKSTRVVEYTGEVVDEQEAANRVRRDIVLLFDLQNGTFIDGDPTTPGPCVNHSCDPNCFTQQVGKKVFIVSARTIESGEELTYEYLIFPDKTRDCSCRAANCRGTLNRPSQSKSSGRMERRQRKRTEHPPA